MKTTFVVSPRLPDPRRMRPPFVEVSVISMNVLLWAARMYLLLEMTTVVIPGPRPFQATFDWFVVTVAVQSNRPAPNAMVCRLAGVPLVARHRTAPTVRFAVPQLLPSLESFPETSTYRVSTGAPGSTERTCNGTTHAPTTVSMQIAFFMDR